MSKIVAVGCCYFVCHIITVSFWHLVTWIGWPPDGSRHCWWDSFSIAGTFMQIGWLHFHLWQRCNVWNSPQVSANTFHMLNNLNNSQRGFLWVGHYQKRLGIVEMVGAPDVAFLIFPCSCGNQIYCSSIKLSRSGRGK